MVSLRSRLPNRPTWLGAAILAIVTGVIATVIATLITVQLVEQPAVEVTVSSTPSGETVKATAIRLYTPFDDGGALRPGRAVSRESGACFRDATNSPRQDARRCFGDETFVHDPCFAESLFGDSPVACPDSPWGTTMILLMRVRYMGTLGQPSAPPQPPRNQRAEPRSVEELGRGKAAWALELVNQDRCLAIMGGTHTPRAGFPQAFECQTGAVIAGELDDDGDLWFAHYFPANANSSQRMAVRIAWL